MSWVDLKSTLIRTRFTVLWICINGILAILASAGGDSPYDTASLSARIIGWVLAVALLILEARVLLLLGKLCSCRHQSIASRVFVSGVSLLGIVAISVLILIGWGFRLRSYGFPKVKELALLQYVTDARFMLYEGEPFLFFMLSLSALLTLATIAVREGHSISDRAGPAERYAALALLSYTVSLTICPSHVADISRVFALKTIPLVRFLISTADEPAEASEIESRPLRQFSVEDDYLKMLPVISSETPNVFIVVIEALRRDRFYELARQNPQSSAALFLKNGLVYSNAFSQATDTDLSFGTILSGTYPRKFESRDSRRDLRFASLGLPQLFRRLGYRTAAFVVFNWFSCKQVLGPKFGGSQLQRYGCDSFERISDPTMDGTGEEIEIALKRQFNLGIDEGVNRQKTVAFLDRENLGRFVDWLRSDPKSAHFGFIYLHATHSPYALPPVSAGDYRASPEFRSQYYSPDKTSLMKQRYSAAYIYVDSIVGGYMEAIRSLPRKSVIVFTGDHGEAFNEHGDILHAARILPETVAVPLVFLTPDSLCDSDISSLAGHVDIAPTLLDLLKLPQFPGYQGRSLCRAIPANRKLYLTSQAFTNEDGIIAGTELLVRSHREGGTVRYSLPTGERQETVSSERQKALESLDTFVRRQIQFYGLEHLGETALPPVVD